MSERLSIPNQEHHRPAESQETGSESHEHTNEQQPDKAETKLPSLDQIQDSIQKEAKASSETPHLDDQLKDDAAPHYFLNRQLKAEAFKKVLASTRQRLSRPEQSFSKLIHRPYVDKASAALGKTLARPSGILAGGSVAFLGSLVLLYMAKHYGFRYNFLLFGVLFAGGYVLGIVLEFLMRLVRRK